VEGERNLDYVALSERRARRSTHPASARSGPLQSPRMVGIMGHQ
jgi:hypothetical protein